jgi:translation initiation factor 3 subunit H
LDRLDLSTNPYLEKHVEYLSNYVDDLTTEQNKFQQYARQVARNTPKDGRNKNKAAAVFTESTRDAWSHQDAPRRFDSLLLTNQIRTYVDQVDEFTGDGLTKLFVTSGLQSSASTTAK